MDPVHDAGRMSWQMNLDLSEQLTIGLFVRDAAALHSELAWLPPVSPAVTGRAPQEPEEAGTQWHAWWTQAVARDPRLERPGPASPRCVPVGAAVLRRARRSPSPASGGGQALLRRCFLGADPEAGARRHRPQP